MREILEKLFGKTWTVEGDDSRGYELLDDSPEGESVVVSLVGDTLREMAENARDAADNYDPDLHAAEIYCGKHGRDYEYYAGAPDDLTALRRDAKWIHRRRKSVAAALERAARKEAS